MVVSVLKYLLDECGVSSDWYWFEVYELGRVFGNIGSLGFVFTSLMSNMGMNFFSRILFGAFALSGSLSFVY